MAGEVLGGILGAGASLIGGYINNQYAKERADEQWARTLYMQDKMNAYNAPVSQMARLKEAGLNPNLVYGNGGAVIQSAGGQPPAPPQSHPIDTQGVLQMVQTIVGAMLEKDKIQASKEMQSEQIQSNKEISEAKNTTTKEVTEIQTKSNERNVDVQVQSNRDIADARNVLEKGIADANRAENARQFNENLRQRISEFNSSIGLQKILVDSQAFKNYTDAQFTKLKSTIEESQFALTTELLMVQRNTALDSYQRQMIDNFISRPYKFTESEVTNFFRTELGLSLDPDQVTQITNAHNNLVGSMRVGNRLDNSWFFGTIDKILGPVKAVLGAIK